MLRLIILFTLYLALGLAWRQCQAASFSGELTFAARQNLGLKTPLVTLPDRLKIDRQHLSITPVIRFDTHLDNLTLAGQLRGELQLGGDFNDEEVMVDELYLEFAVTPASFAFAGRRNIAFGQAVASHGVDVFLNPLEIDRSRNLDRRRSEIEGEDMAGFEVLVTPDLTLAGYYLPKQDRHTPGKHPTRRFATLSWVLPWQADARLLALDAERNGLGLAYAQTLGDALLLYIEGMMRDGRDRSLYAEGMMRDGRDPSRVATRNQLVTADPPISSNYGQITLGGNYTFANALTLMVEYHHDENGYSSSEWEDIATIINPAASHLVLLGLNQALRLHTLRRNYAFLQVSHQESFGRQLASEVTLYHNLDDGSGRLMVRLEREIGSGTLGLYASSAYGKGKAEFKLRSPRQSIVGYYTLRL